MDILVKHNGTNITSHVISYEREHKICTGIGTLTIELEGTINRTFDPWDSIDIHENGDFKVKYYISAVRDSKPDGKITLDCQDKSKALVDFFIPESYLIDYPSYTRYWVEFFLNMADVSYEFQTDSPGQLLSNYTSLGMMTVYEQLLILMQLSGWFFYFDGNGKAIIGPLDVDLADETNSVDKTDILSIIVASDDKMLRNRALVLGAFDVYSLSYAVADITVHTRWNYDRNDIRSMVVVNSNIPNDASAYSIANLLLKEFARITVEKRIEVHGARDFALGNALRVKSNVWKGKGLITTFGVRMSKDGLVTDLVLDERCPRLFGFFDFGDYVYVATFGDGIWRKHLKFDPTWYNYSTGLTTLNITDLHINNGVFGSVGHSGQMFLSTGEGWHPVTVTGLESSLIDVVYSGSVTYAGFSGIMARATIVDKITNNIKFGVDNWSGMNTGDYFMTYSGLFSTITLSGVSIVTGTTISGSHRGWILEYDPYTQALVGGLGSGIYPIHYSGYYNLIVLDLENDGYNDYVSVKLVGGTTLGTGNHENQPFGWSYDIGSETGLPVGRPTIDAEALFSPTVGSVNGLITVSDSADLIKRVVYYRRVSTSPLVHRLREVSVEKTYDEAGNSTLNTSTVDSGNLSSEKILAIKHVGNRLYYVYYYRTSGTGNATYTIYRRSWTPATQSGAIGAEVTLYTHDFSSTARGLDVSKYTLVVSNQNLVINDVMYMMLVQVHHSKTAGGLTFDPTVFYVSMLKLNLYYGSVGLEDIYTRVTAQHSNYPDAGDEFKHISGVAGTPTEPILVLGRSNDSVKIYGWFGEDYVHAISTVDFFLYTSDWLLQGDDTSLSASLQYEYEWLDDDGLAGTPSELQYLLDREGFNDLWTGFTQNGRYRQLNKRYGLMVAEQDDLSDVGWYGFYWDGINSWELLDERIGDNFQIAPDRIFPLYSSDFYYIAKDYSNNFWLCNAATKEPIFQYTAPAGWVIIKPISTPSTYNSSEIYWVMKDDFNLDTYIMPASVTTFNTSQAMLLDEVISNNMQAAQLMGEFYVTEAQPGDVNATGGDSVEILYLDIESIGGFLVLQREGMEYNLIERASYPIRLDLSSTSPLLTAGSGDATFKSNYIYSDEVEVISAAVTFQNLFSGVQVNDYRYTLLEPIPSGMLASGVGVGLEQTGLFVSGSGIYAENIRTYSGGWQAMFSVPSGYGTRIETSNFGRGGQYIFITSSGFVQTFYQMDPGQMLFTAYSGMPQSRATIIRLDDRI